MEDELDTLLSDSVLDLLWLQLPPLAYWDSPWAGMMLPTGAALLLLRSQS